LAVAAHPVAVAAGVSGVIVSVSRVDAGAATLNTIVNVDYSSFIDAFGGDFSDRLVLESLPACALTTPNVASCRVGKPLTFTNDRAHHTLSAKLAVPAVAKGAADKSATAAVSHAMVLAASSAPSGANGGYTATPLKASDAWTAGNNSGSFNWSYPLNMPPALGGSAPQISLDYDSSSVDGRTTASSSQPSDIGEGWDTSGAGGYIETAYKPCSQVNPTSWAASGDMCIGTVNATIGGGAHTGDLVHDDSDTTTPGGKWRMANDDGTRVQMLSGTTGGTNNTSNSAFWELTETDGTVYLYGANRLPAAFGGKGSDAPTYSTWSEPVFGQSAGTNCTDPTNSADLPMSCRLAWRWNLDFKIDPNGNVTRYSYAREEDFYQRNVGKTGTAEYTRSGFLRHIDYGWQKTDVANSTGDLADGTQSGALPSATVQFQVAPRCDTTLSLCPTNGVSVDGSGMATTGITTANESAFPDTPYDQHCSSGQSNCVQYVPTFYSSVETRGVVTSVNTGASTGSQPSNTPANFRAVDSYQFPQSFPLPQDRSSTGNGPELWLNGIKHTGYVTNSDGTQTATSAPEVQFGSQQLPNRSQASSLYSQATFYRFRVNEVADELGADTVVNYSQPGTLNCGTTAPPATTANATLCFPEYYTPTTGSPTLDWFNKYVVTGVTTHDNTAVKNGTGYSKDHTTAYTYLGTPAWHTNDSEQTDPKYRTVDGFRGFLQVQAITGTEASGANAKTLTSYFRGMDQDPTGYVCVNDSHNQAPVTTACPHGGYRDDNVLAGQVFETQTFASDTSSTVVTDAISVPEDPTDPGMVTAVHNRASGLPQQRAHFNHIQRKITYSQVSTSSTPRRTEIDYTYDNSIPDFANDGVGGNGSLIWTDDKGETDASGNPLRLPGEPELCTWQGYALNTAAPNNAGLEWTDYPNEKVTWTVLAGQSCTSNQETSATITAHTATLYDGQVSPGVTAGNVTATQVYPTGSGSPITVSSISGYDNYGRPASVTDADQHTTSTQYFPNVTLLPNQIKTINALNWTSTSTIDRGRGVTLTSVDVNGRQTDAVYDGLGRLLKGWSADHTKAANPTTPNVQYTYNLPGTSLSPQAATPNASTETQTLLENDSYSVAYSILDGFGEQVETQSTPPDDSTSGLLSTQSEYNSFGKPWRTAAVHWDGNDNPSGTFVPYGDALPSETVTTYDGLSRPLTVGQYTGSSITPIAGMVTTYSYPGADRTDESGPAGGTATSTFTDGRGRTTALWTYHENPPARPGDVTDADETIYGLTYQANGTVSTVTDGTHNNTWTTTTNDLLGHSVTKSDPDAGISTTVEDNAGLVQQTTDGRGKTLSYHYDELNRKKTEYAAPWSAKPDSATELAAWSYDAASASDNKTTRGLASSSTRYTQGGTQPGYVNQVNSYDAGGRPTSSSVIIPPIDGNGALAGTYTTNNTYTPVIGLLYETDLPAAGGLPSESVYNSYNDDGLLLSTAGNADYVAATQYDHDGKILSRTVGDYPYQVVQQNVFDAATQRVTNQYIDAAAGQNTANPSGLNTYAVDYSSYTYDAAGLLTSTADLQNWSVSGSFPAGQPGPRAKDLQCYTYDYADRLTNAWSDNGDQNPPSVTTPNSPSAVAGGLGTCNSSTNNTAPTAGNLGGPAPYWQSYTFDATKTLGLGNGALTGNRSTVTDHDVTGNTTKDVTRTSSYPAAGTTNIEGADPLNGPGTTGTGPHLLTSVTAAGGATGTDQYTYDGAGNTTGRKLASGTNQTLTWDAEERLATVIDKSVTPALTATYVYDADGNQLIRRDTSGANAGTTLYLGATEIHLSGTALSGNRYYSYDGAPTIIGANSGAITYEIADSHGTGGTTVNAANGLVAARRYTKPYGDPRGAATGSFPDDHSFLGKTADTSTGLVDIGVRKYDPATSRFISIDPVFQQNTPDEIGGYAYSGDDPINVSDPSGLDPWGAPPGMSFSGCDNTSCATVHPSGSSGGSKSAPKDTTTIDATSLGPIPSDETLEEYDLRYRPGAHGLDNKYAAFAAYYLQKYDCANLADVAGTETDACKTAQELANATDNTNWSAGAVFLLGIPVALATPEILAAAPEIGSTAARTVAIKFLENPEAVGGTGLGGVLCAVAGAPCTEVVGLGGDAPAGPSAAVSDEIAANPVNGIRLGKQLAGEAAASIFTDSGELKPEIVANSARIINGSDIKNPNVIAALTSDGSDISDWGKYTTQTTVSPNSEGPFQVHFYYNPVTGVVNYGIDYKVVFNSR